MIGLTLETGQAWLWFARHINIYKNLIYFQLEGHLNSLYKLVLTTTAQIKLNV